jgi:hypothetical protein
MVAILSGLWNKDNKDLHEYYFLFGSGPQWYVGYNFVIYKIIITIVKIIINIKCILLLII